MIFQIAEKFPIFEVGGAVRDFFLGVNPKDIDYAVEASEAEFERHFPTLEKVGNSFPVYLNIDGSEIALTRKEKCTGNSYQDFECESGVSIVQDLFRRDYTINSLAKNILTGEIIDPFGGIEDIKNKVLRCTTEQNFIDDPLRIIRGIRFSCRYGFTIEESTLKLMKENAHRLKDITPERILLELKKTYEQCEKPSNFFRILDEISALGIHFKELEDAKDVVTGREEHHPEIWNLQHLLNSFDTAKRNGYTFAIGISALTHDFGKNLTPKECQPRHIGHELKVEYLSAFFERHKFDAHTMHLAKLVMRFHMRWHQVLTMRDIKKIRFVRQIRRNNREEFLQACNCDAPLSQEQLECFRNVCGAIDTAVVDVTKAIMKKGKDSIDEFVNNQILKRYREIKNG
jgi:tRNA nucleotidyltransferase (CCA-adding enzyme)